MYVSKECYDGKHIDLLLISAEGKMHHVLIKDFNTFMYDNTLYRGKKYCRRFCWQAFSTEEILKCHIKDCFIIDGKQRNTMPKTGKYVKFKNYGEKIKLPFLIYADFESILVLKDNGDQNLKKPYTNIYQKHITCSCRFKLVYVDDKFSKPFKTYLSKDTV